MAGDLLVVGEQLVRGTFGACFRGDYGCVVEREGGKRRDACRTGGKGDGGTETEWALKMALTLRGQDPAQARRPRLSCAQRLGWFRGFQLVLVLVANCCCRSSSSGFYIIPCCLSTGGLHESVLTNEYAVRKPNMYLVRSRGLLELTFPWP